jgi:quercetin dioxygenase-like cupin family protein
VRNVRTVAVVALVAAAMMLGPHRTLAQDGVTRTDLQTSDLSIPGREVVQQMVQLQPGVVVAKHTHPGEEVTVLLEGTLRVDVAGRASVTYNAGQAFTVPSGLVHGVTNTGRSPATLLATYIVEKGKPLRTAAQ